MKLCLVFAVLVMSGILKTFPEVHRMGEDTITLTAAEQKLVMDVVNDQQITSNIICISPLNDVDILTKIDWGDSTHILLDYDTVNEDIISKVHTIHITDNKPPLYLITLPKLYNEQGLIKLTSAIRSIDQAGRIVVMYRENVGVVELVRAVYNIYMLVPAAGVGDVVTGYVIYEVCQYCDKGEDVIELSNSWKVRSGFRQPLQLMTSFRGSFHGAEVKLGCAPFYPNAYIIGNDTDGNDVWDGTDIRLYEVLAEMANFKFKYIQPVDGEEWYLVSNNTPVGSMRDLHRGDVDMVGCGWQGAYNYYKLSDFSTYTDRFPPEKIHSLKPKQGIRWYAFVQPFSWICIIITASLVVATLYVSRRFDPNPDRPAAFWDDLWDVMVILLWDSITARNPPCSVCILLSSYMCFIFLIVNLYMGELTGCLVAVQDLTPPIDRFEQVWESDLQILSYEGNADYYRRYFAHVPNINDKIMKVDVEGINKPDVTVMTIFFNNPHKYVLLKFHGVLQEDLETYFPDSYHNIHYSKEGIGMAFFYLMYLPSYPQKEVINRKLTLMHGMGLMSVIEDRFGIDRGDYINELKTERLRPGKKTEQVTFNELRWPFLFLMVPYLIAVICFFAEILWFKFKNWLHARAVKAATSKQEQDQEMTSVNQVGNQDFAETSEVENQECAETSQVDNQDKLTTKTVQIQVKLTTKTVQRQYK